MKSINVLIFSKDRALQLKAVLDSFFLHCLDYQDVDINVLYKTSNSKYESQYQKLKQENSFVNFIQETDFYAQTIAVLSQCKHILFLVDDNIFTGNFLLSDVITSLKKQDAAIGFSLRLGTNTEYSYVRDVTTKMPDYQIVTNCSENPVVAFNWQNAQYHYNYPLEVSSSIYRSKEMLAYISTLMFSNPNQLEGEMHRNKIRYADNQRPVLLSFKESVTFCNPVNLVQNVAPNKHGNIHKYSSEVLADYFDEKMYIDIKRYDKFLSSSCHQEVELYFKQSIANPHISIFIAVNNREAYIKSTIESILASTFQAFELIIVDDGSTDRTAQIIKSFNDSRIKYFYKEHENCWKAKNKAITLASAELLMCIDSDDLISSDYLEKIHQYVLDNDNYDFYYPEKMIVIDDQGNITGNNWNYKEYCDSYKEQILFDIIQKGAGVIPNIGSIIKKNVFDKVGLYGEDDVIQDFVYTVDNAKTIKFKKAEGINGYHYRQHNDNLSKSYAKRVRIMSKAYVDMIKKYSVGHLIPDSCGLTEISEKIELLEQLMSKVMLMLEDRYRKDSNNSFINAYKEIKSDIQAKKKAIKRIAIIAQSNNLNFMKNIIPFLKARYEVKIADVTNDNELNQIYNWADVIWLEWAAGLATQFTNLPKRCKIICRLHSYEAYLASLYKMNWKNIDLLIFISAQIKEYVEEKIPTISEQTKIVCFSEGIDVDKFYFTEHKPGFNLAFVGMLIQTKNIALLLQILKMLTIIDNRYNLHVFGQYQAEGPYSHEIPQRYFEHQIKAMKLENNITLHGHVSHVELIKKMENINYILSTSFREGLPFNILEAMAMGIKPLIHNWPGAEICFPKELVFNYIGEIPDMLNNYDSKSYREFIEKKHNLNNFINNLEKIINLDYYESSADPNYLSELNSQTKIIAEQAVSDVQKRITIENTFFTICIFTYNRADMLGQALVSAVNQNYSNYEVVVVDDGSTDNTEEVVRGISSSKIRYFKKEHTNAPDTRNRCIKEASGDFLLWMGSDDILEADLLEQYDLAIKKFPDAKIFFCNQRIFEENYRIIGGFNNLDWYNKNREMLKYFFLRNPLSDCGSLVHKSVYQQIGGYDINFPRAQDFEFWSRVAVNGSFKIKHVDKVLYNIRFHGGNLTGSKKRITTDFSYELQVLDNIRKQVPLQQIYFDVDLENPAAAIKVYREVCKRYQDCNGLAAALVLAEEFAVKFPDSQDGKRLIAELQQRQEDLAELYGSYKTVYRDLTQAKCVKDFLLYLERNLRDCCGVNIPVLSKEEAFTVVKNRAAGSLQSTDYDETIYLFLTLLQLVPGNQDLLLSLTNLHLLKGDANGAAIYLKELLTVNPANGEGLVIRQKLEEVDKRAQYFNPEPYSILPVKSESAEKDPMKVDFVTWERHHYIHLLPIWQKLPDEFKGKFYIICEHDTLEEFGIDSNDSSYRVYGGLAEKAEFEKSLLLNKGPIVTASIFSQHLILGGVNRPIFCVEHGAGQTYLGMEHYLKERNNIYLDLLPGTQVKKVYDRRFPLTKKEVVGGPLLDKWHKGFKKQQNIKPVLAISFHFDRDTVPETRSAYEFYKKIIPEIAADGRWTLLGHGHPRIIDRIIPLYRQYNIEVVRDFDEVMQRADLYICDNSSTIYEFASTDRPVIVLNAPWYRREVEHGLRFWQFADVGVICDSPDELKKSISMALADEPKSQQRRREVIREVYAYTDGNCSARAADTIVKCAVELSKNSDFIYLPDDNPDRIVGFLNDDKVSIELVKKMLITYTRMLVEYLNRKTLDSQHGVFIEDIDFYFSTVCLLQAKLNDFDHVKSLIEDYSRINPAYLPFKMEFLKQNMDKGVKNSKAVPRPLISVIIPTYNRLDNLRKALQSVTMQSYSNFEVIVVNDCGEDVSSVIKSFNDTRITYFNHEVNRGPAAARNSGLRVAKGEFIAYLDDDDFYYHDHLESFIKYIQFFPGINVFYTDAWEHYQEKSGSEFKTIAKSVAYSIDFSRETLLYKNISPTLCFLHKKCIVEKYGYFDEQMKTHEDWDYWLRLSRENDFMHIKKTTCEYTRIIDGNNLSNTQYPDFYRTIKLLFAKYPVEKESQIQEVRDKILKNFEVKLGII